MNEISITVNGVDAFEYFSNVVPRVGEIIDAEHEHLEGVYQVKSVTHRIFQRKRNDETLSYVTVDLESAE